MVTNAGLKIDVVGESCSLDSDAAAERFANLSEFLAVALVGRERTEHEIVLTYRGGDDIEAAARQFAAVEQACCPGFSIATERHDDRVVWRISLTDSSDPAMLDGLWGMTEGFVGGADQSQGSEGSCGSDCGC